MKIIKNIHKAWLSTLLFTVAGALVPVLQMYSEGSMSKAALYSGIGIAVLGSFTDLFGEKKLDKTNKAAQAIAKNAAEKVVQSATEKLKAGLKKKV